MRRTSTKRQPSQGGARSNTLKVLLVEDSRTYATLVRKTMAKPGADRFAFAHVERLSEAVTTLKGDHVDVVLLDLTLPDSDGLETVVRVHEGAPRVPIVVLTGTDDTTLALKAIHAGAQDYLVKERLDRDLLGRAIRYAIERHRLQVELQRHRQEQLEQRERELIALERLSGQKAKTGGASGALIKTYTEVLRGYLTSDATSPAVVAKASAQALFKKEFSGADVIDLHLAATEALAQTLNPEMAKQLIERARFFVLGMMANLVDRYRDRSAERP